MELSLAERIHGLIRTGDLGAAASAPIEAYGPEVLGFLVTLLRDDNDASEVFSHVCEDLWVGLARFEGLSSLRTWFYTLARHAALAFVGLPIETDDGACHSARWPESNTTEIALELVAQPLREMREAGAIDAERLERTLVLVEARIAAGTWLEGTLMLRVTGEKR